MKHRLLIQSSALFVVALLLIACFQNCTPVEQFSGSSQMQSGGSGGNGEPFDFKPAPGTYDRVVPGYTCAGTSTVYASIIVDAISMTLRTLDQATCRPVERTLGLNEIDYSRANPLDLGFEEGIFERRGPTPQPDLLATVLPESWCRTKGSDPIDVVIRENTIDAKLQATIYSASATTPVERAVARAYVSRNLEYRSSTDQNALGVSIDLSQVAAGKYTGRLTLQQNGSTATSEAECRTGRWFDTAQISLPSFGLNLSAAVLPPEAQFSRASGATHVDQNGVIRSVAANVPRFDYDPVSREIKGLLIEPARTNFLTFSSQLDGAAWFPNNMTVMSNQGVAPDGTLTADLLVPTAVQGVHSLSQWATNRDLARFHTCSAYVKPSGYAMGIIKIENSPASDWVASEFNLNNLSFIMDFVGGGANGSASVQPVGGGWFRVSVSGVIDTAGGTQSAGCGFFVNNNGTGNGTSGMLVWGMQFEEGDSPSSVILTTAAAATRAADRFGINAPTWFNTSAGTLLTVAQRATFPTNTQGGSSLFSLSHAGGTTAELSFDGNVRAILGSQSWTVPRGLAANQSHKMLLAYGGTDAPYMSVDGQITAAQSPSPLLQAPDAFVLGGRRTSGAEWNGHIKSFLYWPLRLSQESAGNISR